MPRTVQDILNHADELGQESESTSQPRTTNGTRRGSPLFVELSSPALTLSGRSRKQSTHAGGVAMATRRGTVPPWMPR